MAHDLEQKFITDDHFKAFGRIVQAFVTVEILYAHLIEAILKIDKASSALVFAPYGYDGYKNLLKAIVSESSSSKEDQAEIFKLIDKVNDKSALRNNIAHCSWKPGRRAGSIKPMVLKTRGSVFILGIEHNEKDWTAEELNAEADQILERALKVGEFFTDRGVKIRDGSN